MSALRSSLQPRFVSRTWNVFVLPLALLAASAFHTSAVSSEFQINTTTVGDQVLPWIAVDSQGNFVVSWNGGRYVPPPVRTDVFFQRFDHALNPLGPETQVNANSSGAHVHSTVGMDAHGNFLIVWSANDPGATGRCVLGRHYDTLGNPTGPEFQINTISADLAPATPAMAMNDSGAFVVAWQAVHMFQAGLLYARLYDSNSVPIAPEFVVTPSPQWGGFAPAVEMDIDGKALVTWQELDDTTGIYGQRYDEIGDPLGAVFRIDASGDSLLNLPATAMDADGNFVVVWVGRAPGPATPNIKARLYSSSGSPISPEFRVNTTQTGDRLDPAVARSPSGDFVVLWEADTLQTHDWEIFGQRFDASGNRIGEEFHVNTYTDGYQLYPAAASTDSLIFAAWQSEGQDGDLMGVFGRGIVYDPLAGIDSPDLHRLRLSQNYPNPFNPRTTIEFYLPEKTHAKLGIYDVRGRLIATLVDELLAPGLGRVHWNGRNSDGSAVSSGIYFCRLSAKGRSLTRKMVFLK